MCVHLGESVWKGRDVTQLKRKEEVSRLWKKDGCDVDMLLYNGQQSVCGFYFILFLSVIGIPKV